MGREMDDRLSRKDLLGLEGVSRAELDVLLNTASSFREVLDRPIRKVPTLRGKTVLHLFFEPSTRTQASFDLAAKPLSADIVSLAIARSSVTKGETILDTLKNLEAMKIDAVVIRHVSPVVPHFLSKHTDAAVINAGDGPHEHPTQALLDMLTMMQRFGSLAGLNVLIVGDILHSRVARSNIFGLTTAGAHVSLSGPPTLVPREFEDLGVTLRWDLDDAIRESDVIMALRVQRERLESCFFPTLREYREFFGVTRDRVKLAKKDAILMHPGPVNWGVELDPETKELMDSLILDQVTNGVAVRMAVLYHLVRGESGYEDAS